MIVKVVPMDPALPHQIVLALGRNAGIVDVSCNCLVLTTRNGHKPMGSVKFGNDGLDAIWAIYDRPENHNSYGERPPFVPGDRGNSELEIVW